jgi:hypothetical protein
MLPLPLASARAIYNTIGARIEHVGWTNGSLLGVENRIVLAATPYFAAL